MENILSKYKQRMELAKEIRDFIKNNTEGNMEINNSVTILFKERNVYHLTFNNGASQRDFNLNKFSEMQIFKGIMAIPNINESILVEEVYKACLMVNKHFSKEKPLEK